MQEEYRDVSRGHRDMYDALPLYQDDKHEYILHENFHDFKSDGYDGYFAGYSNDDDEFVVKFEGTKEECIEKLYEFIFGNK